MTHSEYSSLRLGIVCPMANEEKTALRFIRDVISACAFYHFRSVRVFVVLDNASIDATRAILEREAKALNELSVVFALHNITIAGAYRRGYEEALRQNVDWILEIDAGYSHRLDEIGRFFLKMITGEYDCVFGSRFCPGGVLAHVPWHRRSLSRAGTWLTNTLLRTHLSDMTGGYALFSQQGIRKILDSGIVASGPCFQIQIRVIAHRLRITEVPITYSSPSHRITTKEVVEAVWRLWKLFLQRKKLLIQ